MTFRFITKKSSIVVVALLLLTSLVCSQIPLLNYLGFEFSICNAIISGFLLGLLAILLWIDEPPASETGYWRFVGGSACVSSLIILVPLIVITANAFFVKNCSFTQGFRLYMLYVVPSVCFCLALGIFSSVFAKKYKKTLYITLFIVILAHIPVVTLTRPQIFAFNPIAGYFPGITYDESLGGELRLLVYRVGTLAAGALVLTLGAIVMRMRTVQPRPRLEKNLSLRYIAIIIVSVVVCSSLYILSDTLGFSSSTKFIAQQLGGIQQTWHFRIIYPKKSVGENRLRQIALTHEYLFDQLRRELGVSPRGVITVFLYDSPNQKERLVGAARTDFTKPWLRQVHINLEDVDAVLKHELVHAMLADWGIPFLQIAPNSGLIEGSAVAEERFEYGETLHRLAAEIFAVGIKANVAEMFTISGFFKSYPGVSYVMAGSFCRFLIDRYGISRFERVYGSGRFEPSYHKSLDTLVGEWKKMVGAITLSARDLAKAAYLFKRTPLFGRECARVIANLNQQTNELLGNKEYAGALVSAERSITLNRSVDAVFQKSGALFRLGKYRATADFVLEQLSDTTINYSLLPLRLILGDALWGLNDLDAARIQYEEVLSHGVSQSMNEAAAIRLEIVSETNSQASFKPFFMTYFSDSMRISILDSLEGSPVSDNMARYLAGREYAAKDQNGEVIRELGILQRMKSNILEFIRNERLARAYFNLGNLERAKLYYWQALNYAAKGAQLYQTEDALQRCFWIQDLRR